MITGKDKKFGNIFYQQIIDYLHSDKFVEDLKNVLQNKNFQFQRDKVKDCFRAPIKHLGYLQKMKYLPGRKMGKINKEYFYFKEDKEVLRKTFVIQSIFSEFDNHCFIPLRNEQVNWDTFFSNFKEENQFLQGDELTTKFKKYSEKGNQSEKDSRSKSFSEYIRYIYYSNSGRYDISNLFEDLYFDDESSTLKYITREEFKEYQGKDFRLTNLTTLNSFVLKRITSVRLRLFVKLVPYYYSYLSGLITEKQFLPVLVSELREYILEVIKVRIVNNPDILPRSETYPEYFLEYVSFEWNDGDILKCSINEFPISEQKYLLKLMRDDSNKKVRKEQLNLYLYLEEKFKED